jgi:hypothetical protein
MTRLLLTAITSVFFLSSTLKANLDSVLLMPNLEKKTLQITKPKINTDRPSLSDNSYVLPVGSFQNENGFNINFIQNPSNKTIHHTGTLPYSSFRLGVTKRIELRMATSIQRDPQNNLSEYGMGDLEIGTKIQILKDVAWISHLGIPNGNVGYSNNKTYSTHKISATLGTEASAFVLNTGVSFLSNPISQAPEQHWLTTVVGIRHINANTFVFAEGFTNSIRSKGNPENEIAFGFDFGFAHMFTPATQIDFSYGFSNNRSFFNLGFSWGAFYKSTKKIIRRTITPDF